MRGCFSKEPETSDIARQHDGCRAARAVGGCPAALRTESRSLGINRARRLEKTCIIMMDGRRSYASQGQEDVVGFDSSDACSQDIFYILKSM